MAKGRTEFELKLIGAPAEIAELKDNPLFKNVKKAGWERLSSTYFDTPDRSLEKAGLSLRLREEAGGLIQAVKKRGGRASVMRREFERSLRTSDEFPAKVRVGAIDDQIDKIHTKLRPIARIRVDRWLSLIHI